VHDPDQAEALEAAIRAHRYPVHGCTKGLLNDTPSTKVRVRAMVSRPSV